MRKLFVLIVLSLFSLSAFAQPGQPRASEPVVGLSGWAIGGDDSAGAPRSARIVEGIFKRAYDGDNVRIVTATARARRPVLKSFRLIGIDAPERGTRQPYWEQSQAAMHRMCAGKVIVVELRGRDTVWNRKIAKVTVDGIDVGLEQVRLGNAWYFPLYGRSLTAAERSAYAQAHTEAKAAGRGLWALPKPIEPRLWRRSHGRR